MIPATGVNYQTVLWASLRRQWIPNSLESEVAEVLFVDRGEFGDALMNEDESGPPIVGAAAGKVRVAEFRPKGVVKSAAFTRESNDLPAGVLVKCLANIGGGEGREGLDNNSGITQKHVEFKQDELRDCDVLPSLKGFKKSRSPRVIGILGFDCGQ